ncbi:MAG: helix-turn-helix domain-containing protein [Bacteroidales bacterium]|nr:helix-turn-helix domain-containing protein [Bacteroidales bacterium]
MENLKDRIELLISTKGMTNAVFAEKIGVQPSNISHVLSGRNKPSLDLVNKVLKNFKEIRTEWLVNGSGSMTKDYSLFDVEQEESPAVVERNIEQPATRPMIEKEQIMKPTGLKSGENEREGIDIKEDRGDFEQTREWIRKSENKNPHKKHPKSIERIVVFYEDKTFKEYYPED